jgi:cell division protein FtsW
VFSAVLQRHSIHILLLAVSCLLTLGLVMLFSTSAFAQESHGDMYHFVKRQSLWLGIGVIVCAIAALTDYRFWQRTCWVWFAVAAILLALCYAPEIGLRINGERRWIHFGPLTFQPSEFAKIAVVFCLAWWFSKFEKHTRHLLFGFIAPAVVVGILMGLVLFEKDLGTTALIGAAMFAIMFVAGTSLWCLAPVALAAVAGILYVATHIEERMGRLLAFLDPEKYRLSDGLQQWQALIAFGSGGINGLGLGEGRQKMLYLPYAHTDFIFPMIGEELGLRFTLLTVLAFLLFALCGLLVAMNARDRFAMILGFGIVIIISLQAVVNIGVTTSLLPNKGMPLPFISSGGSNLAACLFMIGILINIHRQGLPVAAAHLPRVRLAARVTPRI